MKIVYTENPLRSYVEMSEPEKDDFKLKLYNWWRYDWEETEETAIKWTEHQYPYLITSLTSGEQHFGDCTKVSCSCTKCQAEEILGINTTDGLSSLHYISGAFPDTSTTIDQAIENLSREVNYLEDWHQPHVERWNKERAAACISLVRYKNRHFLGINSDK